MRGFVLAALIATSVACFGAADGGWLKKVPQSDRTRVNPFAGNEEAVKVGANLFNNNCSKCHGENAEGKGSRPTLRSERISDATDGDLAWLLKNGNIYKGMPGWSGIPEQQRWQIVAYIRSLNSQGKAGHP
jgi:mono/diheme cytochrome c family protein